MVVFFIFNVTQKAKKRQKLAFNQYIELSVYKRHVRALSTKYSQKRANSDAVYFAAVL